MKAGTKVIKEKKGSQIKIEKIFIELLQKKEISLFFYYTYYAEKFQRKMKNKTKYKTPENPYKSRDSGGLIFNMS